MAISTIFLIVFLFIYLPGYAGMIIYDIFFKKDPADLIPKQEDEDVDISDEAGKFQPIVIERESKDCNNGKRAAPKSHVQPKNKEKKEVKDGQPLTDRSPPSDIQQSQSVDEDDEPPNRKSLFDTSKKKDKKSVELTDAEKERLGKFERIKQQRLDKFNQNAKEKTEEPDDKQEVKTEKEVTTKPSVGQATKRRHYESPKKVMPMPEGHKAPVFEISVRIADDVGDTKLSGGQTVEQLEEEVKATLADDMAFAQKQLESLWVLSKSELEPEVCEEDILRPPDNMDGTARKAAAFNLPE